MKLKCPVCNGCLDYTWIGFRRFFNCFLCQATYDIVGDKFKRIKSIELKKDINGNEVASEITYEEGA